MVRMPTDREPNHPGAVLLHEFMHPLDLSPSGLATAIGVPSGA